MAKSTKKTAAKKPARKTTAKKPAAKKAAAKKPAKKVVAKEIPKPATAAKFTQKSAKKPARKPAKKVSGYGAGSVDVVMSVEAVAREAAKISDGAPKPEALAAMVGGEPYVSIEGLKAGYGRMEILHDFDLHVGKG